MLNEEVLEAWVELTAVLKNSRLTSGITYNEAIVLMFAYQNLKKNGTAIKTKELLEKTRMQKSLLNRTLNALKDRGYITKIRDEKDSRNMLVLPEVNQMEEFNKVHQRSLYLIDRIVESVGEEDARALIRISRRLSEVQDLLADDREE